MNLVEAEEKSDSGEWTMCMLECSEERSQLDPSLVGLGLTSNRVGSVLREFFLWIVLL